MTIENVIKELRADLKCYIGIMPQSTFSNTMLRIEKKLAKPSTIKNFFEQFGYYGDFNEWTKLR